jgi:hypothetical protein
VFAASPFRLKDAAQTMELFFTCPRSLEAWASMCHEARLPSFRLPSYRPIECRDCPPRANNVDLEKVSRFRDTPLKDGSKWRRSNGHLRDDALRPTLSGARIVAVVRMRGYRCPTVRKGRQ